VGAVEDRLKRLTQIDEEMKAVGHLDGVRRTYRGAADVFRSAIAGDDRNPRMLPKPGLEQLCAPLR